MRRPSQPGWFSTRSLPVVQEILDTPDVGGHQFKHEEQPDLDSTYDTSPRSFSQVSDVVSDGPVETLDPVALSVDASPVGRSVRVHPLTTSLQKLDFGRSSFLGATQGQPCWGDDFFGDFGPVVVERRWPLRACDFACECRAHRADHLPVRDTGHHVLGAFVVQALKLSSFGFVHCLGETWQVSESLWCRWTELVPIDDDFAVGRGFTLSKSLVWVEDRANAVVQKLLEALIALEVVTRIEDDGVVFTHPKQEIADSWAVGRRVWLERESGCDDRHVLTFGCWDRARNVGFVSHREFGLAIFGWVVAVCRIGVFAPGNLRSWILASGFFRVTFRLGGLSEVRHRRCPEDGSIEGNCCAEFDYVRCIQLRLEQPGCCVVKVCAAFSENLADAPGECAQTFVALVFGCVPPSASDFWIEAACDSQHVHHCSSISRQFVEDAVGVERAQACFSFTASVVMKLGLQRCQLCFDVAEQLVHKLDVIEGRVPNMGSLQERHSDVSLVDRVERCECGFGVAQIWGSEERSIHIERRRTAQARQLHDFADRKRPLFQQMHDECRSHACDFKRGCRVIAEEVVNPGVVGAYRSDDRVTGLGIGGPVVEPPPMRSRHSHSRSSPNAIEPDDAGALTFDSLGCDRVNRTTVVATPESQSEHHLKESSFRSGLLMLSRFVQGPKFNFAVWRLASGFADSFLGHWPSLDRIDDPANADEHASTCALGATVCERRNMPIDRSDRQVLCKRRFPSPPFGVGSESGQQAKSPAGFVDRSGGHGEDCFEHRRTPPSPFSGRQAQRPVRIDSLSNFFRHEHAFHPDTPIRERCCIYAAPFGTTAIDLRKETP